MISELFGVNPEQVAQTQSALSGVASELRQARTILGVPIPSSSWRLRRPTKSRIHDV